MTTHQDRSDDQDRAVFWEALGNAFRPYAGWLFYGFGALLVVIGYFGISGEAIVARQLPYLISGGIGGILLAILGAYFLGIEELRRDSGRLDRMERQVEELHRALLERADAPPVTTSDHTGTGVGAPGVNGHRAPAEHAGPEIVVVESGESYHRAGCSLTEGKVSTRLDPADATMRGMRPCPVCEPVLAG